MKENRLKFMIAAGILIALLGISIAIFYHLSPSVAVEANADDIRLPIIMYHSIFNGPNRLGTYVISVDEFKNDLKYIEDNNYTTITMNDLINYIYDDIPLPDKPIMLTFDDGYYNNYLYAFPLLKERNMHGVLSIIGRYTDEYSVKADDNPFYSHVTWDQVREMVDSGYIEIQNHSYNLHTINDTRTASMKVSGESLEHYKAVLMSDITRLQSLLDLNTGQMPTAFTYPFGMVSKDSTDIIKDMGFKASFSCYSGLNQITQNPDCLYLLKRFLRPHNKPLSSILSTDVY